MSRTIEANPRSRRAFRIIRPVAVGFGLLLVGLLVVRGVASVRARKVLTAQLAASTAEVERLGAPRAKLVLPAFEGGPVESGDCPAAQLAVPHRAPPLPRQVAESPAWQPPNGEQIAFVAAHRDEIVAFGAAAAKCDRVAPARTLGGPAWQQSIEMYRRARVLVLAGRARASEGDAETAARLFLQSRRLGVELGLDGNLLEGIIGASAIRDADDVLARLVALGPPPPVREHIGRELAALQPFTPNLALAVRLGSAEQCSLVGALLETPFLTDVVVPITSFEPSGSSFVQKVTAVVLPASARGLAYVVAAHARTDRALSDFASVDSQLADSNADDEVAASDPLSTLPSLAANRARDIHWRSLARKALLEAALELERARDGDRDAHYPTAPQLPLDPFAPGKPLGYELLPDGRYRLSSAGTKNERKEAWIIVSGPAARASEPAPSDGAAR